MSVIHPPARWGMTQCTSGRACARAAPTGDNSAERTARGSSHVASRLHRFRDMHILVSNDDGIYSPGIAALAEVASEFGSVRVVAGLTRSGARTARWSARSAGEEHGRDVAAGRR